MKETPVGKITHYYDHLGVAVVKLDGSLAVGDKIHILGHSEDFNQEVVSMQVDRKEIKTAKKGDEVGLKVDQKVHENSVVSKL